MNQEKNI